MLQIQVDENKEIKYDAASVYTSFYIPVFILRMIITVGVFAVGLQSAIKVGHPSFYKPSKWLAPV